MHTGRILAFSTLAVGVLGLAAVAGLGTPHAPSPAVVGLLPVLTVGAVVLAGLIDGFNPCAFTVLLLFVSSLLAAAQVRTAQSAAALRGRVLGMGSLYIASVFLTYLALGVGLLSTADLFTQRHLPARLGAVVSIALGLWMLKDYFFPELGLRLQAPVAVGTWARTAAQRATVPALLAGGVLIGSAPCRAAAPCTWRCSRCSLRRRPPSRDSGISCSTTPSSCFP